MTESEKILREAWETIANQLPNRREMPIDMTAFARETIAKADAVKTDYLNIVEQAFIDCGAPHDYPLIMEIAKRLTKAQGGPKT